MKALKKFLMSIFLFLTFTTNVYAGTATNSGTGYNITTTATYSYVNTSITKSLSNGSTAYVYGYAAGTSGPVYIGVRSAPTTVSWYISSVSGYSQWAYAWGRGKLSNGADYSTSYAYANS